MGLFGKTQNKISSSLKDFLIKADTAYMNSFATRSMKILSQYLTQECNDKISRIVYSRIDRYFGSPKFRDTEWAVKEETESTIRILKTVTFDTVRIGSVLELGIAEDYCEEWTVYRAPAYKVADIKNVR